jgi:hypothetical protein
MSAWLWMQDVLIEQLLVGMLFLAPLVATLPTTWLLHAVATMLRVAALLSRCVIHSAAAVLEMGSVYELVLWAGQRLWGSATLGGDPDVTFIGRSTAVVTAARGEAIVSSSCEVGYFVVGTAYVPLTSAMKPFAGHVAREMDLLRQLLR